MFAALLLPDFHLQSALRWRGELDAMSVAIAAENIVLECNNISKSHGVAPGLPVPQALARCSRLVLLPLDSASEQMSGAVLLEMAFSLSADVEITAPGCC